MRAGQSGRLAVSWDQTELDGLESAPMACLKAGSVWAWRGKSLMIDDAVAQRGRADCFEDICVNSIDLQKVGDATGTIVLSNGAQRFTALLYRIEDAEKPVLIFEDTWPERQQEFWIVDVVLVTQAAGAGNQSAASIIALPSRPSMERDIHAVLRLPAANASPIVD